MKKISFVSFFLRRSWLVSLLVASWGATSTAAAGESVLDCPGSSDVRFYTKAELVQMLPLTVNLKNRLLKAPLSYRFALRAAPPGCRLAGPYEVFQFQLLQDTPIPDESLSETDDRRLRRWRRGRANVLVTHGNDRHYSTGFGQDICNSGKHKWCHRRLQESQNSSEVLLNTAVYDQDLEALVPVAASEDSPGAFYECCSQLTTNYIVDPLETQNVEVKAAIESAKIEVARKATQYPTAIPSSSPSTVPTSSKMPSNAPIGSPAISPTTRPSLILPSTRLDSRDGFICGPMEGVDFTFNRNPSWYEAPFFRHPDSNGRCSLTLMRDHDFTVATSAFLPFDFSAGNAELNFRTAFVQDPIRSVGASNDGLAFVMHQDPRGVNALGDSGVSLGVNGRNSIRRALVIEALVLQAGQPGVIRIAQIDADGTRTQLGETAFASSTYRQIWVDYCGSNQLNLYVNVDGDPRPFAPQVSVSIDLRSFFDGKSVVVGFTAGTYHIGNDQSISKWLLEESCDGGTATPSAVPSWSPPPSGEPSLLPSGELSPPPTGEPSWPEETGNHNANPTGSSDPPPTQVPPTQDAPEPQVPPTWAPTRFSCITNADCPLGCLCDDGICNKGASAAFIVDCIF